MLSQFDHYTRSRRSSNSPDKDRRTRSTSPVKQLQSTESRIPPVSPYTDTSFRTHRPRRIQPLPISRREMPPYLGTLYRLNGADTAAGKPVGAGSLITASVMLTSRSVVHTEEAAGRCRLTVAGKEGLRLCPETVFVSAPELNLVVIAVEEIESGAREAVDIVQRFTLREGDKVAHYGVSSLPSRVKIVEAQRFFFRSENPLLPGTPVFDSTQRFQGITITPSTSYLYNETIRVDTLTTALLASGNFLKQNKEMKELLVRIYHQPIQEKEGQVGEQLCWFEWLQRRVIKYDILTDYWSSTDPEIVDDQADWHFPWGCKPVLLPDSTLLLVGGSENQTPCSDVMHYSPLRNRLTRCERLKMGRMDCAVVCCAGVVYALGGEFANGSGEKYPLTGMKWTYISPMPLNRYSMNAIAMADLIYIVGGQPLSQAGHHIDRYYPQRDLWERLDVILPEPVCNSGLCLIAPDTFAIMGGRLSKKVFTLQVTGSASSFLVASPHFHTLMERAGLARNTESLYPLFVSAKTNNVYLFNSHESHHRPVLTKYKLFSLQQAPGPSNPFSRRDQEIPSPLGTS